MLNFRIHCQLDIELKILRAQFGSLSNMAQARVYDKEALCAAKANYKLANMTMPHTLGKGT